jgi:hypothetical protein
LQRHIGHGSFADDQRRRELHLLLLAQVRNEHERLSSAPLPVIERARDAHAHPIELRVGDQKLVVARVVLGGVYLEFDFIVRSGGNARDRERLGSSADVERDIQQVRSGLEFLAVVVLALQVVVAILRILELEFDLSQNQLHALDFHRSYAIRHRYRGEPGLSGNDGGRRRPRNGHREGDGGAVSTRTCRIVVAAGRQWHGQDHDHPYELRNHVPIQFSFSVRDDFFEAGCRPRYDRASASCEVRILAMASTTRSGIVAWTVMGNIADCWA